MESDTKFNENLAFHSKNFLQNPYEPKLAFGFSMESSLSNGLNPKFPNCDRITIEGSSSNPFFGVPNHLFNDPFDPSQSSPNTTYFLKDLISFASTQPSTGDGANGLMHGSESRGVLKTPPKSVDRSMDQVEIDKPLNFFEFRPLETNSPGDQDSCLTLNGGNEKKVVSKKKRAVLIDEKNEDHKKSIVIKGQWSRQEDRLLKKLVKQHGVRKWSQIAQMVPGRLGKQCRERWHNHLRPDIKKDTWSEEEDRILIEAHKEIGNKWAEIAKRIPGRSENTIKNHWNATKRRQLSSRRSPNPKYNSTLQRYIQTTISATTFKEENLLSDSSKEELDTMMSEELHFESSNIEPQDPVLTDDYEKDAIFAYDGKVVDEKSYGYVVDEGNVGFELPVDQLGANQIQFEVKREMDFFELLYQDIM